MKAYSLLLYWLFPCFLYAQNDTRPLSDNREDLLESFTDQQEAENEFDLNELAASIDQLRHQPIDLNRVTRADLEIFPFLLPIQIQALCEYLEEHGQLLSLHELQAIPYFTLPVIRQLLPYITLGEKTIQPVPAAWKKEGKNQLILRWSGSAQVKKGFKPDTAGELPYHGNPHALYLRYRYAYSNRVSVGITAEKDAGESFFANNNPYGFDFYSAHLFLHNPSSRLRTLVLGDYTVSMGQGLLLFSGFSTRKGPLTTRIKRMSPPLRRYSSVNESGFFRGMAATWAFSDKLCLTGFLSSKREDGNLETTADSLQQETPVFLTALSASGYHRTGNELADEKTVRQTILGTRLNWKEHRWSVSTNSTMTSFSVPLMRTVKPYNYFYFRGHQLFNMSLDYSFTWRNLHGFGETALSIPGTMATTNGLLATPDPKLDISLLYRHFTKNYYSLRANPLAETSGASNEKGLYLGFEWRMLSEWTIQAYADLWKHPWLRFRTDAPGNGWEWLIRIAWKKRRKLETYMQIKKEQKLENSLSEDGNFHRVVPRQSLWARIHLSYKLTKNLEWRSRIYAGYTEKDGAIQRGTALLQDLKFKAPASPLSWSVRFAVFDTDDYTIRFYAYENDVLNSFTVPAYYDRGSKFYLLMGFRFGSGMLLEGRIARVHYSDRETVGSGLDEIEGPVKTTLKLQWRWNF